MSFDKISTTPARDTSPLGLTTNSAFEAFPLRTSWRVCIHPWGNCSEQPSELLNADDLLGACDLYDPADAGPWPDGHSTRQYPARSWWIGHKRGCVEILNAKSFTPSPKRAAKKKNPRPVPTKGLDTKQRCLHWFGGHAPTMVRAWETRGVI